MSGSTDELPDTEKELARLNEHIETLLTRWKEEQVARLAAEQDRDTFRRMANGLGLRVHKLETQIREARDTFQQLRAIL